MAGQKKTSFDGMTHEQMLAWLDAADAGTVQAAADKLASAAKEIHSIADELKVRPQWVKWKGEGADSFREWAGKLANATVALGDYSQESSKWLGHAAQAISKAKTSVPRDKGVDANIDAARSAHNDPDAQSILSKNMAVRQQTADELDKLGQAYSLSTAQMAAARKPDLLKFPPPPVAIQDPNFRDVYGAEDLGTGRSGRTASTPSSVTPRRATSSADGVADTDTAHSTPDAARPSVAGHTGVATPLTPAGPGAPDTPARIAPSVPDAPARMEVDSVGTLPPTHTPSATSPSTTGPTGPTGPAPSTPGAPPPAYGITGTPRPPARGTAPVTGRPSSPLPTGTPARPTGPSASNPVGRPPGGMVPGQPGTGTGRAGGSVPGAGGSGGSTTGRAPAQGGVTGGRPQPSTGKSATGVPRGTVMGGEGAGGTARGASAGARGPSGPAQGGISGRPTTTGATAGRTGSGRISAGATGDKGVVGGRPSTQRRPDTRSFSQGGSGLVRGATAPGGAGDERGHGSGAAGRAGAAPNAARPGNRREDQGSERPDHVTEDEATWRPDTHRNVPPVVADETKKDER